jgi:hypothetical protein
MANDPQKKAEPKSGGERAAGQATSPTQSKKSDPGVRRRLEDAGYNYLQDVKSAWQEYQDHIADANESFMKAQRDAHVEAQKKALQGQQTYTQAVQDALGSEESQKRIQEAQGTLVDAVREAGESKQKATADAYQEYVNALSGDNEAATSLQRRLEEAYRNYVSSIQQVDVSALDPESLTLLSQSVASVAMYARSHAGIFNK